MGRGAAWCEREVSLGKINFKKTKTGAKSKNEGEKSNFLHIDGLLAQLI